MRLISVQSRGNRLVKVMVFNLSQGFVVYKRILWPGYKEFIHQGLILDIPLESIALKAAAEWLSEAKE